MHLSYSGQIIRTKCELTYSNIFFPTTSFPYFLHILHQNQSGAIFGYNPPTLEVVIVSCNEGTMALNKVEYSLCTSR